MTIIGFLMIFAIVFLLLKGKTSPMVVFIGIPIIAAAAAGFPLAKILEFIKKGMGTVTTMSILFIFSVTFFGIMSDVGMFDAVVNRLVKKAGKNVIAIAVVTAIVSIFSHLDGATVTTVLVTVPAMLPLYKKMKIRPQLLLFIVAAGMGVMNLVPWGGPVARAATVLKMDANQLWKILIPLQVVGVLVTIGAAVLLAMREIKLGAGKSDEIFEVQMENVIDEKAEALKRPKLVWFNLLLTVGVLGLLVKDIMPSYLVFMIGCVVALTVNYPDVKEQEKRIKAHAGAALSVSATMLAAGILVGILGNSGMLEAMSTPLLKVIPGVLAKFLHLVMGVFALPLGLMLGTDSYFYGLMPLAMEVGNNYEITPLNMAITMLIGKNVGLLISPLVPATFLATALAGVELKDHIRYSFSWLWGISLITLVSGAILGIIFI